MLLALALLLPPALGLDPHGVRDDAMGGDYARGSLVLGESVHGEMLTVGDVVVFRAPAGDGQGDWVARRVVDVRDGRLVTAGDAAAEPDPWLLDQDASGVLLASFAVPWLGYPLVVAGTLVPVLGALLAAVLLVLLLRRRRRAPTTRSRPVASRRSGTAAGVPLVR